MEQANAQRPASDADMRIVLTPPKVPSMKVWIAQTALALGINYAAFYLGRRLVRWVVKTRHGRSI